MALGLLTRTYVLLFARPCFSRFNSMLYHLALHGLGILNYTSARLSGEANFLNYWLGHNQQPIVVDVGANEGSYCEAVLKVSPSARIFAFEPHPATWQRLRNRFERNLQVQAVNLGVGETAGIKWLFDYSDQDGSAHATAYEGVIENLHGARAKQCEFNVITLDQYIKDEQIERIDLLKIDCEGGELDVLNGARKAIDSKIIRAIQFEFNEMNVFSRSFFKDFWDLLGRNGFHIFRLLPTGLLPIVEYSPLKCEIFAFQNLVAILDPNSKK